MTIAPLATIVVVSVVAGVMNAIAGGGTFLTFPALVGLGIPPIVANATSTVALWPGAVSSMWGYRDELTGSRVWAMGFAIPSVVGGGIGAWLLLRTPPSRFAEIVPWLVLSATGLFAIQPLVAAWSQRRTPSTAIVVDPTTVGHPPTVAVMLCQLVVGVYGGYFGAGVGILTLAVLGFIGMRNIHRMNGMKNWGGLCMNAVAALAFAFTSLVRWPIALGMAVGSIVGGYLGSRLAQRVPQRFVRYAVIIVGALGGFWLMMNRHA